MYLSNQKSTMPITSTSCQKTTRLRIHVDLATIAQLSNVVAFPVPPFALVIHITLRIVLNDTPLFARPSVSCITKAAISFLCPICFRRKSRRPFRAEMHVFYRTILSAKLHPATCADTSSKSATVAATSAKPVLVPKLTEAIRCPITSSGTYSLV